ncbi:hypothetical protein [Serratia sp. M24T3]|uniref:hypothetical protein n=1 Tax=Serratia sp. M24T3 TaxID=932213 RepID=UPI00025BC07B|nr:hypothetical protein [Serratia sp. M24T3]EIC82613.1 hypothetical protein SPM24T3_21219 [Serratia sp. M24T3]
MKKRSLLWVVIIAVIVGLVAWWFNRTPAHDPHYDAAACVAVDVMHQASADDADFSNNIHIVIDNENSDYSINKVKFDANVAQVSVQRYKSLSPRQKAVAAQNLDTCISVMATGPDNKN